MKIQTRIPRELEVCTTWAYIHKMLTKADEEKFEMIAQQRKKRYHRILKSQQKRHRMVESNFMISGLTKEMVELLSWYIEIDKERDSWTFSFQLRTWIPRNMQQVFISGLCVWIQVWNISLQFRATHLVSLMYPSNNRCLDIFPCLASTRSSDDWRSKKIHIPLYFKVSCPNFLLYPENEGK